MWTRLPRTPSGLKSVVCGWYKLLSGGGEKDAPETQFRCFEVTTTARVWSPCEVQLWGVKRNFFSLFWLNIIDLFNDKMSIVCNKLRVYVR
jgi:hypothetical protein